MKRDTATVPNRPPRSIAVQTPATIETIRHRRLLAIGGPATLLAFVAFFALALRDWTHPPLPWDERVARWTSQLPLRGLRPLMRVVSWPGWPPQNWLISLATAILLRLMGFRVAPWIILSVIPIGLAVGGVKRLVNRARPLRLPGRTFWPEDASFPSGHTVQYTVYFGFLGYLVRVHAKSGLVRWLTLLLCMAFVALIGPSRIYLGHHWPTDVLAGYSLGLGFLFSLTQIYELARWRGRRFTPDR